LPTTLTGAKQDSYEVDFAQDEAFCVYKRAMLAYAKGHASAIRSPCRCRAAAKPGLIHSRCKLKGRPVFKPLLVLMKPAAAGQFHDGLATAKPGSQIEQQLQQFDQHRTRYLAPRVNQTLQKGNMPLLQKAKTATLFRLDGEERDYFDCTP
jgi:hypothetical protein